MTGNGTHQRTITEVITGLLNEFNRRIEKRDADSLDFGLDAYQFARDIGHKEFIAKTCKALAQYYTDVRSEFVQSVKVLEEGIDLLSGHEHAEEKAELLRLLGLNFDYLGELIQSKQAYNTSIRLLQAKKDLSDAGKLTYARSRFNLSIIYGKLELPALAEECLQNAYELYKTLGDKSGIARCYISFGVNVEERNGSREAALEYYAKAAELSKEINDDVSYSVAKGNMAVKLAELGKFDDALTAAFDALEKAKNSANKRFQLNLHRQIGRCYHLKKDFKNSDKWFAEAEKVFLELGLTIDYYDLYRYWADMLFDAREYKAAFEKQQKSIVQLSEMHEFHKNAAVSHATLRLQLDEGKKEQELLKKKNAEIEQYTRKLEASNFELKQFAHVASHDMKEPLRTISNYSQLLNKSLAEKLGKEEKDYLGYVNEGARQMMNVINSMLRLSEISALKAKTEVNITKVISDAVKEVKTQTTKKGLKIVAENMPVINSDRLLMEDLFRNIISNGFKYNKSKAPMVEITYLEMETLHRFDFSDNGIGIGEEYREKVFTIFQRLHARHEYEGAGVGLTICKKIVDILNGNIWIEDSEQGGTKFCVTFPK